MTIRPVRDQILAVRIFERTSNGGIIIPETAEEEQMTPKTAKVVAVGPGKRQEDGTITPVSCKAGDTIVYRPGYGKYDVYTLRGKECLLLDDKNILAVIEESTSSLVAPAGPVLEVRQ